MFKNKEYTKRFGINPDMYYTAGRRVFPKPDNEKGFIFQEILFGETMTIFTYTNGARVIVTEKDFDLTGSYHMWRDNFNAKFSGGEPLEVV